MIGESHERVAVIFASGTATYCAMFEGAGITTDVPLKFKGKKAPAPVTCPIPPVPCP